MENERCIECDRELFPDNGGVCSFCEPSHESYEEKGHPHGVNCGVCKFIGWCFQVNVSVSKLIVAFPS